MDINNLKCCGNCKHRKTELKKDYYKETCKKNKDRPRGSSEKCFTWSYDGIQEDSRGA